MGAVANGGELMEPILVRSVAASGDGSAEVRAPRVRRRVIPNGTARLVSDMLTSVTGPDGTGAEASIDGYLVAGKTGTAQKADYVGGGYARDQWMASFVGFVPADRPRVVIAVVIDEPLIEHYGGLVAGPVFRRVGSFAMRHLGVPSAMVASRASASALSVRRAQGREGAPSAPPPIEPTRTVAAGESVVPDLTGRTARNVVVALGEAGLVPELEGTGLVISQTPGPREVVPRGETVRVVLAPIAAPASAPPTAIEGAEAFARAAPHEGPT